MNILLRSTDHFECWCWLATGAECRSGRPHPPAPSKDWSCWWSPMAALAESCVDWGPAGTRRPCVYKWQRNILIWPSILQLPQRPWPVLIWVKIRLLFYYFAAHFQAETYDVLVSSVALVLMTVGSGGLQTKITSWSWLVMADGRSGNQTLTWT